MGDSGRTGDGSIAEVPVLVLALVITGGTAVVSGLLIVVMRSADSTTQQIAKALLGVAAIAIAVFFGVLAHLDDAADQRVGDDSAAVARSATPSPPSTATPLVSSPSPSPATASESTPASGPPGTAPPPDTPPPASHRHSTAAAQPPEETPGETPMDNAPRTTPARVRIQGAEAPWTGMCLDVYGPLTDPGTPVQIWHCEHVAEMEWRYGSDGTLVGFGGNCLTVVGVAADATPVEMHPCDGGKGQRWRRVGEEFHGPDGYCLDIKGPGTTDGTRVQLWTCEGVPQQQWETTTL
ncbi:ricin-type beta-trefoil lectin protein [Streptomyces sp. TLI_55]|uniref:RICIN domain-containing protein n=1 Tax=Streptomyces sp. TLI_55 TaxID=1938861 RepID=UPI000BCE320B|nr:RICIN domain-containing protein [Streptomyces sp. TLI_55]SNX58014.1 ricin-type beta-trefoil lectin protein [Streptomyces sp. TLI_55]